MMVCLGKVRLQLVRMLFQNLLLATSIQVPRKQGDRIPIGDAQHHRAVVDAGGVKLPGRRVDVSLGRSQHLDMDLATQIERIPIREVPEGNPFLLDRISEGPGISGMVLQPRPEDLPDIDGVGNLREGAEVVDMGMGIDKHINPCQSKSMKQIDHVPP